MWGIELPLIYSKNLITWKWNIKPGVIDILITVEKVVLICQARFVNNLITVQSSVRVLCNFAELLSLSINFQQFVTE